MRRKGMAVVLSAMAMGGALIVPAATQAQVRPHAATLKDHCVVVPLKNGLQLTLCYPT